MSRVDEYELVKPLIWNEESCNLNEIVDKHKLPQVTKVYHGFDGGLDGPCLGHGELLTLHALRENKKLAAKDKNGNMIFITIDCPYKCYILPPSTQCDLVKCTVDQLKSIYPKVKYILALEGHYSVNPNKDSVNSGDIFEILAIEKRKKEVKVKNVNSGSIIKLTQDCKADFKPIEQCELFTMKQIKTLFGFPINIRFSVNADESGHVPDELIKVITETPDLTITGEVMEELVISTTLANSVDLKVCYEIPKNLEVKMLVSIDMLIGDNKYQNTITTLNDGFDATKLLNFKQTGHFSSPNVIIEHKYDTIQNLFLSMKEGDGVEEEKAPPRPPRKKKLESTKSVKVTPTEPKPVILRRRSVPTISEQTENDDQSSVKQKPPPPIRKIFEESNDYENVPHRTSPQFVPIPQTELTPSSSFPLPQTELPASPSSSPLPPPPPESLSPTSSPIPPPAESLSPSSSPLPPPPPPELPPRSPSIPIPPTELPPQHPPSPLPPPMPILPHSPLQSPKLRPSKPTPPPKKPKKPEDSPLQVNPPAVSTRPKNIPPDAWRVLPLQELKSQQTSMVDGPSSDSVPAKIAAAPIPSTTESSTTTQTETHGHPQKAPKPVPNPRKKPPPPLCPKPKELPTIPTAQTRDEKETPNGLEKTASAITDNKSDQNECLYEELSPENNNKSKAREEKQTTVSEELQRGNKNKEEDLYATVARIPEDISGLTVTEVSRVLRVLHLDCYVDTFRDEDIDGALMKGLGAEELESLNVHDSFHKKKIINFINGWRPKR